jgi:hypothetical protein
MIRELQKIGVIPLAIEQPLDLSIPENKMMLAFYLTAPEIENDRRSMNVINGMRRAMKEGRWMSAAPKGYSNKRDENNRPIIVPNDDAKYIQKAFTELANGVKPADHIRRELNKGGLDCGRNNFNKMIKNPVYCGKIRIKARGAEEEMIAEGIHEPIVSEDLYYLVQNVLNGRAKKMKHPKVHKVNDTFPLRGYLECPRCGSKLTASSSKGNGGRYAYYHCSHVCKERVKADDLNNSILKLLQVYTFRSEIKDLFKKVVLNSINGSFKDANTRLQQIVTEIDKTQNRLESLQDKYIDNEIKMDEYNKLKAKYLANIDRLTKDKTEMNIMTNDISAQLEFCMDIMENLSGFYEKADTEGKQRIIGSIFTGNLIYSENKVRTTKVNEVVSLLINTSEAFEKMKKGQPHKKMKLSSMVVRRGIEPHLLSPLYQCFTKCPDKEVSNFTSFHIF